MEKKITVLYDVKYEKEVKAFLEKNADSSIESVGIDVDSKEDKEALEEYMLNTDSEYFFVFKPNLVYSDTFLAHMEMELGEKAEASVVVSMPWVVGGDGKTIGRLYRVLWNAEETASYSGKMLIGMCELYHINPFGSVACCLFRKRSMELLSVDEMIELLKNEGYEHLRNIYIKLFAIGEVLFSKGVFVALSVKAAAENELKEAYDNWFFSKPRELVRGVKKRMTFYYTDKGEYYNVLPIAREAEKRGYETVFTDNIREQAEIGIYCQHVCYPGNAKFSVILLHDMAQGHNRWPNIWEQEPWNEFDIGVLPGETWGELWKQCGELYYANPRFGVYQMGYPKSDEALGEEVWKRARQIKERMGLKYAKTVLYAPSWENDEKEDDFVRALASLPINLLVKQANWPLSYGHIIRNISDMRDLHEGKYDNLFYIEPEESISIALRICDLVVSDESSVMAEALLFNVPSLAVSDWLIPDTDPPRKASVPMDYVISCKRVEMREYVDRFLNGDKLFESVLEKGKRLFGNRGCVCKDIVDAIEYFTGNGNEEKFKEKRLMPLYLPMK